MIDENTSVKRNTCSTEKIRIKCRKIERKTEKQRDKI